MIVELKSSSAMAKISTEGAELRSFVDVLGTEYIWQRDPAYWKSSSPFLFPIVGNLRDNTTLIDGKEYHLSKHGFCRGSEFRLLYSGEDRAILSYTYNEETLKVYPYKFSVTITYTLVDAKLCIHYDVMNLDEREIYYCLGTHPAFQVPLADDGCFEDYCVEFEKEEDANVPIYDLEKLEFNLSNRRRLLDHERVWNLKYSDFDNDAIVVDNVQSKQVKLRNRRSGRGVEFGFEGFCYIAFWTPIKKNAPFLCMEPWAGMAVCNDEDNEYTHKHGVRCLQVNERQSFDLTIMPL